MKVKRIITTIEVEDNNSTTSVELTKLFLDIHYVPVVITDISTNGCSSNINIVYNCTDNVRCLLDEYIKGIANAIDNNIAINSHIVPGHDNPIISNV